MLIVVDTEKGIAMPVCLRDKLGITAKGLLY